MFSETGKTAPTSIFNKFLRNALPALGFSSGVFAASEQIPEVTLPSMTVSVQGPVRDKALKEHGSSTKLTQKALSVAHQRSIDEILRGVPGISVSKGGAFGLGVIYSRGVGGNGLIMLDGMPIPDSVPGIINLNALLPDGLEQITVKRGFSPAAQAFSSMGGIVEMTSRDAAGKAADTRIEGGSFGFLQETLRGDWAETRGRFAVTLNRTDAFDGAHLADLRQGNTERDPYHGTQVMSKGGLSLSDNLSWEGSVYFRASSTGSDQYGLYNGAFAVVDQPNEFIRDEFWMAQNSLDAQISSVWRSRLRVGYTHSRNRSHPNMVQLGYTADLYLARWENNHTIWAGQGGDSLHILWGAEGRHESAAGPGYDMFRQPGPAFSQERNEQAGFVDARYAYKKFNGDIGIRYEAYDRFKDHVIVHAGAAWEFTPQLRLRANGGNGFRIPGYNELLYPLRGNPALQPEHGIGGDLGFDWRPFDEPFMLNFTGFYNRFDDLISLSWNPQPSLEIPCLGLCMSNIAKTTVAGFEAAGDWTITSQWHGGAAYTYTDSRNLENGRRLPFRPRDTARLWAEWRSSLLPISIWAEGVYRGHAWNDVDNTLPLNDALRFNARINYKILPKMQLYVRGENLTGNKTVEAYSFDYPGFMVFGGFELKL